MHYYLRPGIWNRGQKLQYSIGNVRHNFGNMRQNFFLPTLNYSAQKFKQKSRFVFISSTYSFHNRLQKNEPVRWSITVLQNAQRKYLSLYRGVWTTNSTMNKFVRLLPRLVLQQHQKQRHKLDSKLCPPYPPWSMPSLRNDKHQCSLPTGKQTEIRKPNIQFTGICILHEAFYFDPVCPMR